MPSASFSGFRLNREPHDVGFQLTCACGATLTGKRQPRYQVVRCPDCAAERFVLPLSPFADFAVDEVEPASERASVWSWLSTVIAAFVLVAALAQVVLMVLPDSTSSSTAPNDAPTEQQLNQHLTNAQAALAEGAYGRAANQFQVASDMQAALPNSSTSDRRRIEQWQRQSALLADLCAESLSEILRHSIGMPEDEWVEVVRKRYRGQSIVLDDIIAREATGRYRHGFAIKVLGTGGRIELGRLRVLADLPLVQPQRMLLGWRIEEIRRGADGFTIMPDPDSGVLVSDPEVFVGLSLPLDAELREVLKRQRGWLELP